MHVANRSIQTLFVAWILRSIPTLAIGAFVIAECTFADTERSRRVLGPAVRHVKIGPGADFSGKNLRGTEIVGCDLTGAVFDDATLAGARLFDCVLNEASFNRANLENARISECKINGADFADAVINNIVPTQAGLYPELDFTNDQLKSTRSFKAKNLSGWVITRKQLGGDRDLSGFDLTKAMFALGDFRDVRFDEAKISGASFNGMVDFEQLRTTVDVRAGRFPCRYTVRKQGDLSGMSLAGAELSVAKDASIDLTDADINRCQLRLFGKNRLSVLYSTKNFKNKELCGTVLWYVDLSNCKFDGMTLRGVSILSCDLTNATFDDTTMDGPTLKSVAETMTIEQLMQTTNFDQRQIDESSLPEKLREALSKKRNKHKTPPK